MNRVMHFEIPCENPQTTMDFFKEVFGWSFEQWGTEQYWTARTGDENSPGINGGFMKKRDPNQPVTNSIEVANLDQSAEKIKQTGGTIVVPKMGIPGMGWVAYFKDPDGNLHGLFQSDPDAVYTPAEQAP